MKKEIAITVSNEVEATITGEETDLSLFNGTIEGNSYTNTTTFAGVVKYNGNKLTNPELVWHSTNEEVATVEDGVVTALTQGETQIYYTYNDGEDEFLLEVQGQGDL